MANEKSITKLQLNKQLYYFKDLSAHDRINKLGKTPEVTYVTTKSATEETTSLNDILTGFGNNKTIYRIPKWNGTEYDITTYSEYVWDGTKWVLIAVKPEVGPIMSCTQDYYDSLDDSEKNNGTWYFIEEEE